MSYKYGKVSPKWLPLCEEIKRKYGIPDSPPPQPEPEPENNKVIVMEEFLKLRRDKELWE